MEYANAIVGFVQGAFFMFVWAAVFAVVFQVVFWFIPKY